MNREVAVRSQIPWRVSCCGGPEVNGTEKCISGVSCQCSPKPHKNYVVLMKLLAKVYAEKLHVCTKNKVYSWAQFTYNFCNENNFRQVQGTASYIHQFVTLS